jgi:hypothetical protein
VISWYLAVTNYITHKGKLQVARPALRLSHGYFYQIMQTFWSNFEI